MTNIQKVGVIGAGVMGSGIVQKLAQENIKVVMLDVEPRFVEKGLNNIKSLLDEGIQRKLFTKERTEQILANIKGTTDINDLKDVDLVIEAVFEDKKVKQELFQKLDRTCSSQTIIASNTSSFSISDLANSTKRLDKFVGLHFFYHPAKNRLLEIIPGKKTAPEVIEATRAWAERVGKTAIIVKDASGFAVNRFFVPWLNEAARLLGEDVANPATIDAAAKKVFQIGMGPFELMNVTGIPIAYHSTVTLGEAFGPFYAPAPRLAQQFESKALWDIKGAVDESKFSVIGDRLLGVIFLVAGQLVDEGITTVEDIDRGAKIGLRWVKGPFELMNELSIKSAYKLVQQVTKKYKLSVPKTIEKQTKTDKPWSFKLVDLEIKDTIATITINRPEAMNALNEEVVRQLDEAFTKAEADAGVKTIIFRGKGKAFVAGADIAFFVRNIEAQTLDRTVEFTKRGQDLLMRIDKSKKYTVALIDGLALGGGAELTLACDARIMTERGTIGFPETGIGIYPGLGATQRLPRLIGRELAKYLIFTGEILDARAAQSMGLAQFISVSDLTDQLKTLARNSQTSFQEKTIIFSPEINKTKSLFSERVYDLLGGKLAGSADVFEAKIAKKISYKAPLALKWANQIIDEGLKLGLEQGLQVELAHLTEIFSTKDAYEGLTSILQKRRPTYRGN
jgi:enoyl-CoA hydratase/3-hydroxyacyl-CoA dehydrogenase